MSVDIAGMVSTAQQMATTAAQNATDIYNQALTNAQTTIGVSTYTVDAPQSIDLLSYSPSKEYDPDLMLPDMSTFDPGNSYASVIPNQRTLMKTFVAGGMTDWITSFAPDFIAKQKELTDKITVGLAGGSAIDDTVEQAIFDRSRSRVDAENTAAQLQLSATMAKRGFPLPAGVIAAGVRVVNKDSADRIARAATEAAIHRSTIENQFATACLEVSQGMNSVVQQSILSYASVVATINESTLNYASAAIAAIDLTVKTKLFVAEAGYKRDDAAWRANLDAMKYEVDSLAKKVSFQIEKAQVFLDKSKAQVSASVETEQLRVQAAMNRVNAMVNAASAGASPQASIAGNAISAQNTLVQQTSSS